MKKLIAIVLLSMFLSIPVFAADRMCPNLWDNVQANTYTLTLGEDSFDIIFSGAYAGPCPQGKVEFYQGEINLGSCRYMSKANDVVTITCDGVDLDFILIGNKLIYLTPDTLILEKQ